MIIPGMGALRGTSPAARVAREAAALDTGAGAGAGAAATTGETPVPTAAALGVTPVSTGVPPSASTSTS